MRKALTMFAPLSLLACVHQPVIVQTPPAACSKLIPSGWKDGVEATPVPANADMADMLGKSLTAAMAAALIAPWAGAYVGMSGQLDKANGHTADTISIVGVCESQANAARAK